VTTLKMLMAGVLMAGPICLVDQPVAKAEPLIPPTPGEMQFFDHVRRALPGSGDRVSFNSDAELLDQGRYACTQRDLNQIVGTNANLISPIVSQLAFVYLCPR
jgi:hypothetical protein